MTIPDEVAVEVFRTGDYGPKGCYTEADLDRLAQDYNPAVHEAPVTFDHQQSGPAHGWVKRVQRCGDRLVATLVRISDTLATALRTQGYKKRSVELYRRLAQTGGPYLKAVSFLGAAAPEAKGLADPQFSESVTLESAPDREAEAARARAVLMEKGAWKPQWEERGLTAVFSAVAGTPQFDELLAVLSESVPPVPLGRLENAPASEVSLFAENLVGGASADSVARHRNALEILRDNPALGYRDALLMAR